LTSCEADERNRRALYEIGRQRTDDAISLSRIEHILRGDNCGHETGNDRLSKINPKELRRVSERAKEAAVTDDGRWKPGDSGIYKEISPRKFLMVRDRADILGLQAGDDGWKPFTVVPDGE